MRGTVRFKMGRAEYSLMIEEKTDKDTLLNLATLGNPPHYCDACKQHEVFKLEGNKDKEGNVYIKVVCKKCFAQAKLGTYKTGGYFWHKFEVYQKPNTEIPTRNVDTHPEVDGTYNFPDENTEESPF